MGLPRRFPTHDAAALARELEQFSDAIAAQLEQPRSPKLELVPSIAYGDAKLVFGGVTLMNPLGATTRANLPAAAANERRLIGLVKTNAGGTVTITPPGNLLVNGLASLGKAAAGLYLIWFDDSGYWCTA